MHADLDSLTSSLLYSFIRSQAPPRNAFTSFYIPLLNLPASDLALRPEFTDLFRHANISASHLITLDDLPSFTSIHKTLVTHTTRWILVDHNKLQGTLGDIYSSRVHGVIDHHDEEHAISERTDPEPRVIRKCGSCTSLVVQYLESAWDDISRSSFSSGAGHAQGDSLVDDSAVTMVWDAQVAKMALASILVDTANLTGEGKVEDVDRAAVAYLESKIRMSTREANTWDTTKFYEELNDAKRDIGGLSLNDILRKDYKEWTEKDMRLGISSVVKSLEFIVDKASNEESSTSQSKSSSFDKTVKDFMGKRDLTVFAIMTTSTSPEGQFQRELFLHSKEEGTEAALRFEKEAADELGLQPPSAPNLQGLQEQNNKSVWRRVWLQKDVSKSRKQVAPLLRKALQA